MSVSETVRPSVRYTAPIACSSKFTPSFRMTSFSQVCASNVGVAGQFRGGARKHDDSCFQDVATVCNGQGHGRVLLDEQDRRALAVDGIDGGEDLLDEHGRQAHAGLVQQE